jgi:hypothetical protein
MPISRTPTFRSGRHLRPDGAPVSIADDSPRRALRSTRSHPKEGQQGTGGASRLWSRAAGTMAPALVPWTTRRGPCQRFARKLRYTAASPRRTTQPSTAPLTCVVVLGREVPGGVVNHPRIDGMQIDQARGQGFKSLSSTPVSRPLRRRPPANPAARAAIRSNACAWPMLVQGGGHVGHHRRGRLPPASPPPAGRDLALFRLMLVSGQGG